MPGKNEGVRAALVSAVLFGMSPVACKAVAGDMPSILLAGLLYLGSGLGLTVLVLRHRQHSLAVLSSLSPVQRRNLAGAVLSGGVAAPFLLAYGIRYGTATEVSLLLNFEAVATTFLAWVIFHEHIGYRVWAGKIFIMAASVVVVASGGGTVHLSIPGLCVLAACLLWGIDNNLTREIDVLPPFLLAFVKGWSAGTFNTLLALLFFPAPVSALQVSGLLVIGALSYGTSLILFIRALREIGSARTSTWFASGPFIGALLSVLLLGERPPAEYWLAAAVMLCGMFLLYGERHRHRHHHEALAHSHRHVHDEHHRHRHAAGEGEFEHEHFHVHEPLTHAHAHWPDIHHRHGH